MISPMLSRVLPMENLHRSPAGAGISIYDEWPEDPDWIFGYWPPSQSKPEAASIYKHMSIWRDRALPNTVIWLWVERLSSETIKLLAEKQGFFVQAAPVSFNSSHALLQCTIPWGVSTEMDEDLINPIGWVQSEIKRFCALYSDSPIAQELREFIGSSFRNDYLYYLPERMAYVVNAIGEVAQDPSAFFRFRGYDWNIDSWRTIWNRIRDTNRSLNFWSTLPIAPSDLAPNAQMDIEKVIFLYHYWWEQLLNPPVVIWSPWAFHLPAATATLERGGQYYCSTWKFNR